MKTPKQCKISSVHINTLFNKYNTQLGQNIQEWTKQNFWKTAFKKFEVSNFLKAVFHKFY